MASLAARGGLVAAGLRPAAVATSEDEGATWRERPLPRAWWWTPSDASMRAYVQAVALGEEALVAGVEVGGVLASRDGGRTWRKARGMRAHAYGWAVAADPARPGRCYATSSTSAWAAHGGRDARALLSRLDGTAAAPLGGAWRPMPYGLVARPEALYLGLADGSARRSLDEGATWTEVGSLGHVDRAFVVTG